MNMRISDLGLEDFNSYFINEDTRKLVKLFICGAYVFALSDHYYPPLFSLIFLFLEILWFQ